MAAIAACRPALACALPLLPLVACAPFPAPRVGGLLTGCWPLCIQVERGKAVKYCYTENELQRYLARTGLAGPQVNIQRFKGESRQDPCERGPAGDIQMLLLQLCDVQSAVVLGLPASLSPACRPRGPGSRVRWWYAGVQGWAR